MEIAVTRDVLNFLLGNLWHVAEKRSTIRILSCVLFRCSKKKSELNLAATNIKTTIQERTRIEADFEGGFGVQAKSFYDIVKVLPENEVRIEKYKDDRIKISSGKYNVRIPILPQEEFPTLPVIREADPKKNISMTSRQIERLIDHTRFSISDDETRPYINGALFETDKNVVRMVTTDGHRMSIYKEEPEGESKPGKNKILIPLPGILELKRLLSTGEDKTLVSIDPPEIHFQKMIKAPEGSDVEILMSARLTDSEFPPYDSVIPRSNDKICVFNRQGLLDAVKRVAVLSTERFRTIKFQLDKNLATLRAEYADVGDAEEVIDVGYEGDPVNVGFNSTYLVQVLGAMGDDLVEARFGGELDGAIFKPAGNDDFTGIVMPIRL